MLDFELKNHDEFTKILANYHISKPAKKLLADLKLVLILAPTSTGRSVLIRQLVKTGHYFYIVSDTTRPPQVRDGKLEKNGHAYFFKTEEEVLSGLRAGQYLEAEIVHDQQVSGISIRELEAAKRARKIAITEVEHGGVDHIKAIKPDTVAILLLPPSFEEWQSRIAGRGGLGPDEINRRLLGAAKILQAGLEHDYFEFVIAGDVSRTTKIIDNLAAGQSNPEQAHGRQLAHNLLKELAEVIH